MGLLCVCVCARAHRCVFVSLHVCLERNVASVGLIAKFAGWSDLELIVWGGMKVCLLNLLKTHTHTYKVQDLSENENNDYYYFS